MARMAAGRWAEWWLALRTMNRVAGVVGSLVVGFVIALIVGWVLWPDSAPKPPSDRAAETSFPAIEHDPVVANRFIEAWERWRMATFVTDGTWKRTLDGGGSPLSGPVHVVQDPPRRIVERLGATIELISDSVAACEPGSTEDSSVTPCVAGDSGLTYRERVEAEMNVVRDYVEGNDRAYDIGSGTAAGCYRAELARATLGAPWGRWVEFCFDNETGALTYVRVRRQSAVDEEIATVTRSEVTEADFASD